jgi:hypothetical protein
MDWRHSLQHFEVSSGKAEPYRTVRRQSRNGCVRIPLEELGIRNEGAATECRPYK